MRARIQDLEGELGRQKEQYSRKSSVKPNPNDPELERLRAYIRQLEDDIANMKR
jgi:hypothetical protein